MLSGLRVSAGMAFLGLLYAGIVPGFSSPGEPIKLIGGSALIDTPRPESTPGGGLVWTLAALAQEGMPAPAPVGEPADGKGPVAPPSFSVIEIAPDGHVRFQGRGTPGTRVTLDRSGRPLASAIVSTKGDWSVSLDESIGSGVHVFGSMATKPNNGLPIVGSDVRISIPSDFGAGSRREGSGITDQSADAVSPDVRRRAEELARGATEQFSEIERQRLSQATPGQGTPGKPAPAPGDEPKRDAKEGGFTFWLQDWLASSNRDFQGKIVRPLQVPAPQSGTATANAEAERRKAEAERQAAAASAKAQAEAAARAKAERVAADRAAAERRRQEELSRQEEERRAAAAADARDAEAARQAEEAKREQAAAAAREEEAGRTAQAAREAEQQRQREAEQQAEAARRAVAERQAAAAEEARRQREAEERAAAAAREEQRRLREERERALLAAEAEERRRRAQARSAAEAERRRDLQQRMAAKAERTEQLRSIAKPATPTDQVVRRQAPPAGLRGGDGTPDDAPEPDRRAGRPSTVSPGPDGHVMPEGWRRLAQNYSGGSRSGATSRPLDAGASDDDARRGPRVMGMARRATSQSCRLAGRRIKVPGTYVVRSGDSLWRISRRHYRRGKHWPVIFRANDDKIDDPDLIYPCQRFYLPRLRSGR